MNSVDKNGNVVRVGDFVTAKVALLKRFAMGRLGRAHGRRGKVIYSELNHVLDDIDIDGAKRSERWEYDVMVESVGAVRVTQYEIDK